MVAELSVLFGGACAPSMLAVVWLHDKLVVRTRLVDRHPVARQFGERR